MTDQELLISTLREAGRIIAAYLEPRDSDPQKTLSRLIAVLDNEELARAVAADRAMPARNAGKSSMAMSASARLPSVSASRAIKPLGLDLRILSHHSGPSAPQFLSIPPNDLRALIELELVELRDDTPVLTDAGLRALDRS